MKNLYRVEWFSSSNEIYYKHNYYCTPKQLKSYIKLKAFPGAHVEVHTCKETVDVSEQFKI